MLQRSWGKVDHKFAEVILYQINFDVLSDKVIQWVLELATQRSCFQSRNEFVFQLDITTKALNLFLSLTPKL